MVAIAATVCLVFGALFLVVGIVWDIVAAISALRSRPPKPTTLEAAGKDFFSSLAELVNALTEFFRELRKHSKPFRFIMIGILLLMLGGGLSLKV